MEQAGSEQAVVTQVERLEIPLAGGGVPVFLPMFAGLFAGLMLRSALTSLSLVHVSETAAAALSLAFGLAVTMLAVAIKLRQLPDRLRITPEAVEFARGNRAVSRVRLAKLAEINELDWPDGKVLVLSDDRHTLAVIAAQLADPRQYGDVTRAIAEAVGRVDPSGGVGRMAVQAARLREVVARRPIRATFILAGVLALASFMALRALGVLNTEPFPLEDLGALSTPLVRPEAWRILSYVFIPSSDTGLLLSLLALLWIGGSLEKLVGWERMMFAFLAGVIGGAVGYLFTRSPLPIVGAEGGVFGLIGLLAATSLRARRHPQALRPQTSVWLVAVWYSLFYAVPELWRLLLGHSMLLAGELPVLGGGLLLGFTVGLATVLGVDVPASKEARREWRGFAVISSFCLIVGLVGGVTHHSRATHSRDNEIVVRALLHLNGLEAAAVQNEIAYMRLRTDAVSRDTVDFAERLASAAVENSDRKIPAILDTLAVARYKQGDSDDAKALLDEALRLRADQASASRSELELKDEKRTYFIINRHLQDINAGGPLRPDPDDEPADQ